MVHLEGNRSWRRVLVARHRRLGLGSERSPQMNKCGHQFCPKCGELLIHLLHRSGFESASGFGQVVWREGPARIACGDVDLYVLVRAMRLLRIIEHKQIGQRMGECQRTVLVLLAALIELGRKQFRLHDDSGVFAISGAVEANPKRIGFASEQKIYQVKDGAFSKILTCTEPEELYRWLEATDKAGPRRKSGHWLPNGQ
jgi:hypothetical protein